MLLPHTKAIKMIRPKELLLAADLLRMAADEFGNHGCNDIDEALVSRFTTEEKIVLAKELGEYNGDPEEERNFMHIGDYALMGFMAFKLRSSLTESLPDKETSK